jgi:hypothetical protein
MCYTKYVTEVSPSLKKFEMEKRSSLFRRNVTDEENIFLTSRSSQAKSCDYLKKKRLLCKNALFKSSKQSLHSKAAFTRAISNWKCVFKTVNV